MHEINVMEWIDKLAIQELLYKFARAADRCDRDLLSSLYHPDATADHAGVFVGPASGFVELAMTMLGSIGVTTHHILNTLVEVHADQARCEAYAVHFHRLAREGMPIDSMIALRHLHRFERRAGEWRIAHHHIVFDWNRDSPTNETWGEGLLGSNFVLGRKDKSDPVYAVHRR
ncbi:MAG TPA: nuclear transport factor 2 family protein [Steroidobacter sp.]|uniref:nuclear transport factor 2 family protein n=1 Tax=Steroidobacter sp. TaxID=1978227 RepID=UPI002EDAE5E6